jgi:RNA polymerase sigma factor (sigma-70 family)
MQRNRDAQAMPEHAVGPAASGDAFQENATKIYAFIYSKVGNRAAAEDLTSQVFLKAVRWLAADRSADSIRSWLYATARTAVADYWREQSVRAQVPLADIENMLFQGSDGPAESRRTREWAHRVLAALPEREREVLRLRFLKGYSAAEVGQALGLTAGNVRVIQLRALQRAASMGLGPAVDDDTWDRGNSDE